ncbi:hypothetical protein HK096_003625, partial [Nowakowskiella sp. JEL0078]
MAQLQQGEPLPRQAKASANNGLPRHRYYSGTLLSASQDFIAVDGKPSARQKDFVLPFQAAPASSALDPSSLAAPFASHWTSVLLPPHFDIHHSQAVDCMAQQSSHLGIENLTLVDSLQDMIEKGAKKEDFSLPEDDPKDHDSFLKLYKLKNMAPVDAIDCELE